MPISKVKFTPETLEGTVTAEKYAEPAGRITIVGEAAEKPEEPALALGQGDVAAGPAAALNGSGVLVVGVGQDHLQSSAPGDGDSGTPLDEALMEYITEVLEGTVTAEKYVDSFSEASIFKALASSWHISTRVMAALWSISASASMRPSLLARAM